jgi:hypothetical protein
MGDEEGRSSSDIEEARRIAGKFAEEFSQHERARGPGRMLDAIFYDRGPTFLRRYGSHPPLLDQLAQQVQAYEDPERLFLAPQRHLELQQELNSAAHLVTFAMEAGLPGVPVYKGIDNVYGAPALFDVFNPLARIGIAQIKGFPLEANFNDRRNWPELGRWVRDAIEHSPNIAIIGSDDATNAYLTLFVDSLRATARVALSATVTTYTFTVNSTNAGYSLESYPQFKYSPVGFGSTPTTPVVGTLPGGHYCFQGWRSGTVTQDPGVYYVGPGSTAAFLKAF